MANNSMLTIKMITREALRLLEYELAFTKSVRRDYGEEFAKTGAKIGDTLKVRVPTRFTTRLGPVMQVQDYKESSTNVTLTTQRGVDVEFGHRELLLDLDDFSERILKPAVSSLANQIDLDGIRMAVANTAYSDASTIAGPSFTRVLNCGALLDVNGVPRDGNRTALLAPYAQAQVVDQLKGLFQSAEKIGTQYDKGVMGQAGGFTFKMDQNIPRALYVVGGATVAGANQQGNVLNVTLSSVLPAGQVAVPAGYMFTIAGVNAFSPISKQDLGTLKTFSVTDDVISGGSSSVQIKLAEAIVPTGPNQNVTTSPANGATISPWLQGGPGYQNLIFHRDAFNLVTADLPIPRGVDTAAVIGDKQTGLSVRMIKDYDIKNDVEPCRLDILYGWNVLRPELACRMVTS